MPSRQSASERDSDPRDSDQRDSDQRDSDQRDSDQRDSEHDDDHGGNDNDPASKGIGRQLSKKSKEVIDKTWSLIWSDVSATVNDAHHVMQAVVKPLPVSRLKIRMHHSTSDDDSAAGGLPATYGKVTFTQDLEQQDQKPALFACMSSDTDLEDVKRLLLRDWRLKPPSVIISVTGSAAHCALDSGLEEKVTQGIARAASATHAWTFTGGTDTGVMKLVAGALASAKVATPIIGVAAFHKITEKERLFNAGRDRGRGPTSGQERNVHYIKRTQNSDASSSLDDQHTHFLLVDGGIGSSWGSEIEFRGKVEEKICEDLRVPRVLLVIQGGPGTFQTVNATLRVDCHVVIVKESGGCAQAVAEFAEPLLQQKLELLLNPRLLEEKVEERLNDADFLERLQARLRPSARPPARCRLCTLHSVRPPASAVAHPTTRC